VPLRDIEQAAGYVRQNIKEAKWLTIGLIFAAGLAIGLMLGYWPLRINQNNMHEQLNRIEQDSAAPSQPRPTPAVPDPHAPTRKGKAK
jgi:hypothetical protein